MDTEHESDLPTTTCLCVLFMDLFFGPSDLGEAFGTEGHGGIIDVQGPAE